MPNKADYFHYYHNPVIYKMIRLYVIKLGSGKYFVINIGNNI